MRLGNYNLRFIRLGEVISAGEYFYPYSKEPLSPAQLRASEDYFKGLTGRWVNITPREWADIYSEQTPRIADYYGFCVRRVDGPEVNEYGEVAP